MFISAILAGVLKVSTFEAVGWLWSSVGENPARLDRIDAGLIAGIIRIIPTSAEAMKLTFLLFRFKFLGIFL